MSQPMPSASVLTVLMSCADCERRWSATYPMACMRLECPGCARMIPAPIITAPMGAYFVVLLPLRSRRVALALGAYHAGRLCAQATAEEDAC